MAIKCFAFFSGEPTCMACKEMRRCKTVLMSDGFNLVADALDSLVAELDPDAEFTDTIETDGIIKQLMTGGKVKATDSESELLKALLG